MQGSLHICCILNIPAFWGLWIRFPVSHHHTTGHLVTTTPNLQYCQLTEKSCYYKVSFKNKTL